MSHLDFVVKAKWFNLDKQPNLEESRNLGELLKIEKSLKLGELLK